MALSLFELPGRTASAYACFAFALFLALGSYQFVAPVKQALFFDLVGTSSEPLAKSLVLVVLVPALLLYSILFSALVDPKLLMLFVGGFFAMMYALVAIFLESSGGRPGPWIAWVLYYLTEFRAVVLMPMIWSIVNDVTSAELATGTYPLIFFVIQVGGIAGSFVAINVSSLGGVVGLLLIQAAVVILIVGLTWRGCVLIRSAQDQDPDPERVPLTSGEQVPPPSEPGTGGAVEPAKSKQAKPSLLYEAIEGLWLLLSRPYAFMTFWVSYATLMPRTVLDYTNGVLVKAAYPDRDQQVAFWGNMGLVQNCCIALVALLGTKPIVQSLGLGRALLVLPITVLCAVVAVCIHDGLWVTVVAVVTSSVVAFGLNSPCKEMLYIRTSREIKYKAKSWSEMYGNELMKILGAQINLWINNDNDSCRPNCFHEAPTLVIVVIWVSVWISVAWRVGNENRRLEETGQIVE